MPASDTVQLPLTNNNININSTPVSSHPNSKLYLLHKRLAHFSVDRIAKMCNSGLVLGLGKINNTELPDCLACAAGKMQRKAISRAPVPLSTNRFYKIHSDVCGPFQAKSLGGNFYFVTFTDDCSRYTWIAFMKTKSEVFDKFKIFLAYVKNHFGCSIQIFHCDNGGEYELEKFKNYCAHEGILFEYTAPHTPEHNGVAERKNRTLVEGARCLLQDMGLDGKFWAHAILFVNHVNNRAPTKALNNTTTPFELMYEEKPDLSHVRVFGCPAAVLCEAKIPKLAPKIYKCLYLGPNPEGEGNTFYNLLTRHVIVSRNATFYEKVVFPTTNPINFQFPQIQNQQLRLPAPNPKPTPPPQEKSSENSDSENDSESNSNDTIRRYPLRNRKGVDRFSYFTVEDFIVECEALTVALEPKSHEEAMQSPESNKWKEAEIAEINNLKNNNTYILVDLPPGRKAIGVKWVYKIKLDGNGKVERYKARLVAKGYRQKKGIDYYETFSPVAKMTSIRVLLAVAVQNGWAVHQLDITAAYLNGIIDAEIYMTQPPGYVDPANPNKVCKLQKGLYGLKQAGRLWYEVIVACIIELGFVQATADVCIFVLWVNGVVVCVIALYVDDFIITGILEYVIDTKQKVMARYAARDLGEAKFILGIQITHTEQGIELSQSTYVQKILEEAHLADANRALIPASRGDVKEAITPSQEYSPLASSTPYRNIVGRLMYAMVSTRPDIAFTVGFLGRYSSNPNEHHMAMAKHAMRYLVGTVNTKIVYRKSEQPLKLELFVDSDWAGSEERKSTSGYVALINGAPVSWQSKRQQVTATSSTEAEYIAASQAAKEVIWLRRLLADLGHPQQGPTTIHEDNNGCIDLAKNPVHHSRTKHIDVQHHFIREKVASGEIQITRVSTSDQIADLFTKALDREKFTTLCSKILEFSN